MATATSSEKRTAVRGLGEIALRVNALVPKAIRSSWSATTRVFRTLCDLP